MQWLVVMGVAGCGKSSVGRAVANRLRLPLIEGDDFHPAASVAKMRAGIALDDADRDGWLDLLGAELRRHAGGAVLTCSALKQAYRERLRAAAPGPLRFAHLVLDRDTALARVGSRSEHPFPASLVDSQFETLQRPTREPLTLELAATRPIAELAVAVGDWASTP